MNKENNEIKRILIADDEPVIRSILREILCEKYSCVEVGSAEEALEALSAEKFNLVISDIQMSGISGLEMTPRVREIAPDTLVIMISGQQRIESAIAALRVGAFDFITKPFTFDHVEAVVNRAIEYQSLLQTKRLYENHLEELVTERTAELHRQIGERQRAEEKVNRLAYYDSLTDLPNPTLFRDRLTHELSISGDENKLATIFISLDRFKNINDTLGYAIGEQLLESVARRLSKIVSKTDTIAYFGGDQFALLLREIGGVEDVTKVLQSIRETFAAPFECGAHELFVTASFGVSLSPDDGADCQTLLKNSGAALYQVQQNGGDSYQFFTGDMHEKAFKRLSLESSLRRALERDEFVLYYQPQICSRTDRITGVEALVRWLHPELGLVPPNDFIPIAEDTGMIVPLGEWVLETACRQNVAWQNAGFAPFRMGVNLSLRQLQQSDLTDVINRIMTETGLNPSYLELEVTESLMMCDAPQTIETLGQLRARGIKISIDDFGTGYSSLSHLKDIPLDALKIDKSFVRDMMTDRNIVAIVKTIIALAHNFKLKTIAEGVETEEQASYLRQLGCDEMQGYLFGKPLPAGEIETLFKKQQFAMSDKTIEFLSAYENQTVA
jgi:diguanylate cyclase (GGDEF)-like protein